MRAWQAAGERERAADEVCAALEKRFVDVGGDPEDARLLELADEVVALWDDLAATLAAADAAAPAERDVLMAVLRTVPVLDLLPAGLLAEAALVDARTVADRAAHELVARGGPAAARQALAQRLRELGRYRESIALLEGLLAAAPPGDGDRMPLLAQIAELERAVRDGAGAEALLAQMESAADRLRGAGDAADAVLVARIDHTVASERAMLELMGGRPDQAAPFVERAEEIVRNHADPLLLARQEALRISLLLGTGDRDGVLRLIEEHTARERSGAPLPPLLELLRTIGAASLAAERDEPLGAFVPALRSAALTADAAGRLLAVEFLVPALLDAGRVAEAERWIALLRRTLAQEAETPGGVADKAFVDALAAMTALAASAPRERLAALRAELQRDLHLLLEAGFAAPLERRGSGRFFFAREEALLGAWFGLSVALHGKAGAEEAVDELIRLQALHGLARKLGAPPCGLAEVRAKLLSEERGVLLFLPAPNYTGGCRVVAFDRAHLEWAAVGSLFDARRRQRRLMEELLAPPADDVAGARASLAQVALETGRELLPEPVAGLVRGWRGITAVGFEAQGWFPLEGVALEGMGPLGLASAIDHLPSLPLGLLLVERRPEEGARDLLLLVATTPSEEAKRGHPEIVDLEFAASDHAALVEPFHRASSRGPDATLVLSGAQANVARLRAEASQSFRALFVVAHGVADPGRQEVGLALASSGPGDDGLFWREQVAGLPRASLVVLAACSAARAPIRPIDVGTDHWGGPFLEHGASAVLIAHDAIPYRSTLRLLAAFATRLRAGLPPAEALRQARVALVQAGLDHPMHHSFLQLFGTGHGVLFSPPVPGTAPIPETIRRIGGGSVAFTRHAKLATIVLAVAGCLGVGALLHQRRRRRRHREGGGNR